MKVALIDHNDSFTYNIIDLLRQIKFIRFSVINYNEISNYSFDKFDRIILSPGPSIPNDYPKTIQFIAKYYKTKPILGICLGHQLLSEFFGCKLYNLKRVKHGVSEEINTVNNSCLYKGLSINFNVGLYHSWVVSENNFSEKLLITAKNTNGLIMSMEHKKLPVFGIQYHLESFLTKNGKKILENFIHL